MRIAIQTLGCKVNQVESQAMERLLRERGHQLVSPGEAADAFILNSCTVTAASDQKSRQLLRRFRRENPGAVLALCGCYPQVSPQEAQKLGADLLGGTGDREGFLTLLEEVWDDRRQRVLLDNALERREFESIQGGGLEARTRAMLKVEDGCVNFCAFCIIPYARGPVRSQSLLEAAAQAARLAEEGYREIVLTGIELASWGQDLKTGETLADLVEAVCRAAPGCRIRLGSLEPRTVTEDFCRRLQCLPNLCPHFHLSLQSGCDETLLRMKRRYDTARYRESVELLRAWFENPGITTDLIVGFPGETEEAFRESLAFIEVCRFSAMHIFPYSIREGTVAATMPEQVSKGEKASRAGRAEAVAAVMEKAYLESLIGRELQVLFEEERDGFWRGHAGEYVEVRVQGEGLHNRLRIVKITGAGARFVYGEVVEEVEP